MSEFGPDAAARVLAQLRLVVAVLDVGHRPAPRLVEVGRHIRVKPEAPTRPGLATLRESRIADRVISHSLPEPPTL